MTALLRKDFYVTRKHTLVLLVVILSFAFTPQFEFIGFAYLLMISMSTSHSAIACDERCRWDVFAAMLPIRPEEIVLSKYIYSFLSILGVWFFAAAVNLVWMAIDGGNTDLTLKILFLAAALVLNAVFLPVIYRLGTKRSQTVLFAAAVALATLVVAIVWDGGAGELAAGAGKLLEQVRNEPAVLVGLGAAAAVIAVYIVSFPLSVRFYRNRRAGFYD